MTERNPERAARIAEIFDRVVGLPREERTAELARLCSDDDTMQEEVHALLEGDTLGAEAFVREKMSGPRQAVGHADETIGSKIGPYTVKSEIGRGGMGVVYFGVREEPHFTQRAAVKVIKKGFDTDEVLKRFELERQVLSALNHPNIARMYEGGTTVDGRPYFAMEYVEGLPIAKYCDNNHLSTRERLELFRMVCDAIQYAHQNLIVHRDIKPTNILVTPQGEPKLLDFGIAKMLNAPLFQARAATSRMMRLMTPEYASPEQVRGEPIGATSDVYSLGVLLYELLTGRRPYRFTKSIEQEIVRVICEVDPERPSTAATHSATIDLEDGTSEEVPPEKIASVRDGEPSRLKRALRGDIDVIVLKALEKIPNRRYGSAQLLSDDIVNYLSGLPIRARPAGGLYKAKKFVKRNRAVVTAAALVFLSLMVGVIATTWQWQRAEASAERARATSEAALALADEMITELPASLNSLAGTIEARKIVAETLRRYLTELNTILERDPSPSRLLAIADTTSQLGKVLDDRRGASLGLTEEAIELHQQAAGIYRLLLEGDPTNPRYLIRHGQSLISLADLRYNQRRFDDALSNYERAIAEFEQAKADEPYRVQSAVRMAGAYEGTAKIAEARGEIRDALDIRTHNLERRRRTKQNLSGNAPVNTIAIVSRNLASGHIDVARTLHLLGRQDEAIEHMDRAIEIRRPLVSMLPDTARYPRDLAYSIATRCEILTDVGRHRDAEAQAIRAADMMRDVYHRDTDSDEPGNRNALYLGEILLILSRIERANGDADSALDASAEAVELLAARARVDASNILSLTYHAHALLEHGRNQRAMTMAYEAVKTLSEAVRTIEQVRQRDQLDTESSIRATECSLELAHALVESAETLEGSEARRRMERAGRSLEDASALHATLVSRGILPPWLSGLGDSIGALRARIDEAGARAAGVQAGG